MGVGGWWKEKRERGVALMMEAARTSETSVDNHFTRQYNPEDSSEHLACCVYGFCTNLSVNRDYSLKQRLIFVMVMCGCLFEVRPEFLNIT
jgi:hypothetical protein